MGSFPLSRKGTRGESPRHHPGVKKPTDRRPGRSIFYPSDRMETSPEKTAGTPATDAPGGPEIDEARDLVNLFLKALKAYRLYLPNNRTLQAFVDAFYDTLQAFLGSHGELCLRVSQFRITYHGEPVYESTAKEESLAFRLFINGVRDFTFHESVPMAEVAGFLQVINRAFDAKATADDLLTQLWERDLRSITFIILDDFFEEGEQADFEEFVDDGQRADHTAGSMKATMQPLLDRLLSRSGEIESRAFPDIMDLTPEEVDRLSGWIEEENERNLIHALCGVLLHLLEPDGDESDTREVLRVIDRVLESLLEDGKFTDAIMIIRELRAYGERGEENDVVRGMARDALSEIGGDRMVRLVSSHLPSATGEKRDFLIEFLSTLDQTAVPALLDLLEQPETKDIATRVLKIMAPQHFSILVNRLKDPRRTIVTSVIRLLGEVGDPRAVGPLRAAMGHADPAIRREAIRAVASLGAEDVLGMLRPALEDEEQDIRIAAVRALSELPPAITRYPLLEMAQSKDFPKRNYFEKKEILLALAAAADLEVEDWLTTLATKRSWLRREERDELRACAVAALARIGSGSAMVTVRECLDDKSPQVCRAAAQALRSPSDAGATAAES